MKTSNIILLTLLGSITFLILAGAMQLRFTGVKKSTYSEVSSTVYLMEFRYLVIRNSVNLSLMPSKETKMVIRIGKNEANPRISYRAKGDTLIIDEIRFGREGRSMSVTVETPLNQLRWIQAENAHFALKDFAAKALQISLDKSRISLEGRAPFNMGNVTINGTAESHIYMHNVRVDTLDIHLDNSTARVPGRVTRLTGTLGKGSSLFAPMATEIEIKKDSLSTW